MSAELSLRDVTLSWDGLPVLDGVSLTLRPGEVVALVGPSGSGKSTLLDVAAGLHDADGGTVRLDGAPVTEAVGRVALMPQGDSLLPWRTLLGNVAVAAEIAGAARRQAARVAREAVQRVGLAGFEDHYPHALSGGMRQRAALARTMLARRDVWLLDEPFGALDALTRLELREELLRVWETQRPTVLLVTHDAEEAAVLADRVLVGTERPLGTLAEIAVTAPRPRDTVTVTGIREAVLSLLRAPAGGVTR